MRNETSPTNQRQMTSVFERYLTVLFYPARWLHSLPVQRDSHSATSKFWQGLRSLWGEFLSLSQSSGAEK